MTKRILTFLAYCMLLGLAASLAVLPAKGGPKLKSPSANDKTFEGLPGVKAMRPDDDQGRIDCTSSIERPWPDFRRNGLGRRVYRCEDGAIVWKSTRPPDEIEWRKQQLRQKPWIADGF